MTDITAGQIDTIEQVGRSILGVGVHDLTQEQALALILDRIDARIFSPIAFLNAHNANLAYTDGDFASVMKHFTVLSDGIGLDLAGLLLKGRTFRANLNGTDLVPALLTAADRPLKVGLFGARPGIAEKAVDAFNNMDPRHTYRVAGNGFIEDGEVLAMLDSLKQWRPDILLVALGVPRQEKWIAANLGSEHCTVPMAVGALFDLTSGTVPRAPGWVRTLRGEWVHRLIQEPWRLWRRYLVGNPLFLWRVLRQRFGQLPDA